MYNTQKTDLEAVEAVVPGVVEAYKELTFKNPLGIYTSGGAFFNHTFFGRDAAMSARFVTDFDHETALKVIEGLMQHQGRTIVPATQEAPGRMHHELRDFKQWQHGRLKERGGLFIVSKLFWGMKQGVLRTYFSTDSTGDFVRLVNKYCHRVDPTILERPVRVHGQKIPVSQALEQAADWIVSQVDHGGRFMTVRGNYSLPFQSFQDSVTAYAWSDRRIANYHRPHSFVEVQAFAADALEDASRLLSGITEKTAIYKTTAHHMRDSLLQNYWDPSIDFFTSLLSERNGILQRLDVPNISAGWTLNTSWWDEVPLEKRVYVIRSVLKRLFSDEFLTDVGIRTRSRFSEEPLKGTVDYHGSQTVWPMFNYMIAGSLKRHRMFKLAAELERRIVNGCNAVGEAPEFMIVDKKTGRLQRPRNNMRLPTMTAQMVPEKNIAFTVVPLFTIARSLQAPSTRPPLEWQQTIEEDILRSIKKVPLFDPRDAARMLQPREIYLRRNSATIRSFFDMTLKGVRK